jgi:2-methylcitrate dehydratase PrpD
MHETRLLAEWAANLRYADIPEVVLNKTRLFVLDNLGCQIAGATLPWSKAFHGAITETRSGSSSTVVFYGGKLSPDDAAFLNSAFNHANEMDDTHFKSPTHPGGIAVPAAFAMAEHTQNNGKELLVAIVAAYELQIRIAWSCSPHLAKRGHHPPVGVGPFGAAAASGVMLGFDAEKMLHALAIAGSHSAGIAEYAKTGGSVKRMHSAIPTQAGVRSALFAKAGITGPRSVLEGEKGFFNAFAGQFDAARLTGDLGRTYHMLDTGLKPHACPHFMQAALDAIDDIRAEHPVKPDEIKAITVYSTDLILNHICAITEPKDPLEAQFSLAFSLAMRLHHGGAGVHGGNGFWDYPKANINDPALLATARKIKRYSAGGAARVPEQGIRLDVEMNDGRGYSATVPYSKGLPENPLSPAEIREKFLSLADPVLKPGTTAQIIELTDSIDSLKDINGLMRLLVA